MSLKYFPNNVKIGNFSVKGAIRIDASAYFTGPLESATGLIADGSAHFGLKVYHATGIAVTDTFVCATRITTCGVVK